MIDVNVKATHILTKELLPGFIKRNCGYILNVASSAGLLPGGPYMATYYATKAYVTSFTSAIYEELKDTNCKFCGTINTTGYTFDSSIAVVNGKFIGLPIDEVNEDNKTAERISKWVEQVKQEIS